MKRKQHVYSPTTKRPPKRRYVKLTQIEERFALLLALLQHNFNKVVQRTKTRRK
jgi:hypothetical protein